MLFRSKTTIDVRDYPGLEFLIELYDRMKEIRLREGLPIFTFEEFINHRRRHLHPRKRKILP